MIKMETRGYHTSKEVEKIQKRTGKCDFKKCKGACCSFLHLGWVNDQEQIKYMKNFPDIKTILINGKQAIIMNKPCNYLDKKTFKCKLQNKRKPVCCRQFPLPTDGVYALVAKKCSYKFKEKMMVTMGLK